MEHPAFSRILSEPRSVRWIWFVYLLLYAIATVVLARRLCWPDRNGFSPMGGRHVIGYCCLGVLDSICHLSLLANR